MMTGRRLWWGAASAAGWLVLAAGAGGSDPPKIAGELPRTVQRFAEAARLEKQQRWKDAVETYLRLADDAGDDLVPDDDDGQHLLPARALVNRRIAARPELLAPYRERVEGRAQRLLQQGLAARDSNILDRVVDQYFCSRSADTALQMLGDLACERGEFDAARRYWGLLIPGQSSSQLCYPDPSGGPALARAKSVLARLLSGQRAEAVVELQAFRRQHPGVVSHLAGRDGNLVDILQAQLDAAESVRVAAAIGEILPATTFAGDAGRNGALPAPLPHFAPQPNYEPIALPGASRRPGSHPVIRPAALAFHPVIAHGQVFVADARRVSAYELSTGRLSGRFDLFARGDDPPSWAMAELPLNSGGEFTLTVDGDRVYARLGPPYMRPGRGESASVLACLQWHAEPASPDERLKPLWTLPAAKPGTDIAAAWEGTPIVADGRLFAALTRIDGARAVTALACYRQNDPAAGPLWQRDVYEAPAETADRMRPFLLTLAGPTLAYCSHAGVMVGLEAATGRRAWAVRYPSRQSSATRDPAPIVCDRERLYAAPADSDRVYCLNAFTGARIWTSEPMSVTHLLGVEGGSVICTLGGFHAGLCALDAGTGERTPDWGYRVSGSDAFAPLGRGLLCGDRVYWPTRAAGVQGLRRDGTTGYPSTALRELPAGNLAFGDGFLVVATPDRLFVLSGEETGDARLPRVGTAPAQSSKREAK